MTILKLTQTILRQRGVEVNEEILVKDDASPAHDSSYAQLALPGGGAGSLRHIRLRQLFVGQFA